MKKQNGYVLDAPYPIFFYKEMQPLWLNTVLKFSGFNTIDIDKKFSYLELGCATGINLLVCAILNPHGQFIGVDFNQQHIEKAKGLAAYLEIENIEFIHGDFQTFLETNQNQFDFIVNHGTFTWVSAQEQDYILQIVAKFLKNLGVFYLHYMCYPGSSALQPIQKLLHLVDQQNNESSLKNIEIGKTLFSALHQAGTFVDHPQIEAIIKSLENSNSYLVHEFLTDYWQPLYSVDLHQKVFSATQMNYIGSANPVENVESLSIPRNMQQIVQNQQAPELKEYLKDLARNSKQRVDIFQKKPEALTSTEHVHEIGNLKFKLLPHVPKNSAITFHTNIGEIKAPKEIISEVFGLFVKNEAYFYDLLKLNYFKQNPMFLIETIFLLMNEHYLQPVGTKSKLVDAKIIQKFNHKMQEEGSRLKMLDNTIMHF